MKKYGLPYCAIRNLAIAAFCLGLALAAIISSFLAGKVLIPPILILISLIVSAGLGISAIGQLREIHKELINDPETKLNQMPAL